MALIFFPNTLFEADGLFSDVTTDADKAYCISLVTQPSPLKVASEAAYLILIANGTVYNYIQKGTQIYFNDTSKTYITGTTPDIYTEVAISIPSAEDTGVIPNEYKVSVPSVTAVTDGQLFQMLNTQNTNNANSFMIVNLVFTKQIVDSDGNALAAGMLVAGSNYLFSYNAALDKIQMMTLARP